MRNAAKRKSLGKNEDSESPKLKKRVLETASAALFLTLFKRLSKRIKKNQQLFCNVYID